MAHTVFRVSSGQFYGFDRNDISNGFSQPNDCDISSGGGGLRFERCREISVFRMTSELNYLQHHLIVRKSERIATNNYYPQEIELGHAKWQTSVLNARRISAFGCRELFSIANYPPHFQDKIQLKRCLHWRIGPCKCSDS